MNDPNSSAQDRLFLVRPDQYEELFFADDSADDDEILRASVALDLIWMAYVGFTIVGVLPPAR